MKDKMIQLNANNNDDIDCIAEMSRILMDEMIKQSLVEMLFKKEKNNVSVVDGMYSSLCNNELIAGYLMMDVS